MTGRLSRVTFSSSAVALALVLAAPSAALADDDHGRSGDNGTGVSQGDGHNPPGNNGTIKIDYPAPADSGHANRPHPGCAFQLRMFNFDDDQTGTITFVGQAPTKLGTLLTQTKVLLSDDAAGGGQDVDATYAYTAEQLGLLGKPQAKQGWHIKVSVDADDAPGGAKQKVFWLSCPVTSTTTGTTAGGAAAGATESTASTVTSSSTRTAADAAALLSGRVAASRTARSTTALSGGSAGAAVTGGGAVGATATAPAARRQNRGSALPFTGAGILTMLVIALAALVAGGLAIRAGRRRTAQL